MADEVPPTAIPDPQLEAILEVLKQLFAGLLTKSSGGAGAAPEPPVGADPQLAEILDVLTQILAAGGAPGVPTSLPQLDDVVEALDELLSVANQTLDTLITGGGSGAAGDSPQLNAILEELRKLYDVQTAVTATEVLEVPDEEKGGGISELLGVVGEFKVAILAAVGILLGAVAAVTSFVQALDPGLVEQFGRALQDLRATIGVAFVGIFEQGMNFIRALAAAVQPVFQALKPVIDQLVGVVLKGLSASLSTITPVLLAVVPILKVFADLLSLLAAVLRPITALYMLMVQVFAAVLGAIFAVLAGVLDPLVKLLDTVMDGFQGLIEVFSVIMRVLFDMLNAFITSIFGGSFEELIKQVADAFKELIKWVILTAAKLALMAGSTDFVERMRNAFNQQGQAATGSTSIKGLEQIGKDMATASVNAAGVSSAKDATNADIVKSLDALLVAEKQNSTNIVDAIMKSIPGGETAGEISKVTLQTQSYARSMLNRLNPFSDD